MGRGEVRIRQTAVGLNFIDIYDRTGLYPIDLPSALGRETAGVIVEIGPGVRGLKEGDRVAYVHSVPGAYANERVMPAGRVVIVPEEVTDEEAAAVMLKGLTAWYLLRHQHSRCADHSSSRGLRHDRECRLPGLSACGIVRTGSKREAGQDTLLDSLQAVAD